MTLTATQYGLLAMDAYAATAMVGFQDGDAWRLGWRGAGGLGADLGGGKPSA